MGSNFCRICVTVRTGKTRTLHAEQERNTRPSTYPLGAALGGEEQLNITVCLPLCSGFLISDIPTAHGPTATPPGTTTSTSQSDGQALRPFGASLPGLTSSASLPNLPPLIISPLGSTSASFSDLAGLISAGGSRSQSPANLFFTPSSFPSPSASPSPAPSTSSLGTRSRMDSHQEKR